MKKIRIDIIPSNELPPRLAEDIRKWLIADFSLKNDTTTWSAADWHILGWLDEHLVSHVDVLERTVTVEGNDINIAGIGGVVTKQEWRREGIATHLMKEAQQFFSRELDVEYGLLMCDQKRIGFYQGLGWIKVDNTLEYDQPTGKEVFDDQVMVFSLNKTRFPRGKIDINGYPW